jgi:hypothetical protein
MIDSLIHRFVLGVRAALEALDRACVTDRAPDGHPSRMPPKSADQVLLSHTHLWLRRVPSRIHPRQLCRHHPHLANRLAQCWGDKDRVERFIDELLIDSRDGREGLPERVVSELQCLERFHAVGSITQVRRVRVSRVPLSTAPLALRRT